MEERGGREGGRRGRRGRGQEEGIVRLDCMPRALLQNDRRQGKRLDRSPSTHSSLLRWSRRVGAQQSLPTVEDFTCLCFLRCDLWVCHLPIQALCILLHQLTVCCDWIINYCLERRTTQIPLKNEKERKGVGCQFSVLLVFISTDVYVWCAPTVAPQRLKRSVHTSKKAASKLALEIS